MSGVLATSLGVAKHMSMGGLEVVMCGDPAQIQPIGDERMWKPGAYSGKAKNKRKKDIEAPVDAPSVESFVDRCHLFRQEFEDVVILQKVHRSLDGDGVGGSLSDALAVEQQRFLEVVGRMADLEWTREDHAWLSQRNRSVMKLTAEGRAELAGFEDAPLLMDGRRRNALGEDGAQQYNAEELRKLSRRTGKPIAKIGAYHDKPSSKKKLKVEELDAEDFKGLQNNLDLCVGARVILTSNEWVEAGLMNGALGYVRGFMWPEGGDPNSADSRLRAPICVFVEFDDVHLGEDSSAGRRSFFPGDVEKSRWIPIYRKETSSESEENVVRKQFPLELAWALTHWKAQGMTLPRVRISMGSKTAGQVGVGMVAVTRVKHVRHLVFEKDLSAWEDFQQAKFSADFRGRQRFMLRLRAKFSRTLRRYGRILRAPPERWSDREVEGAENLIRRLQTQGSLQRASVRLRGGPIDEDADVWPDGVDVARQLALAVQEEARGDEERLFLEGVAVRLQQPYHMPALREALGCLIPEHLHPRLDGKKPRGIHREGCAHIGVHLEADRWRVDVSEEACLQSEARALSVGTLEFFLKVIGRICEKLELPLTVGSTALGRRLGDGESVDKLLKTIRGWKQWGEEERKRVRKSKVFMVPVCWDPMAEQKQDWVLAEVFGGSLDVDWDSEGIFTAVDVGGRLQALEDVEQVVVRVYDAMGRDQSVAWAFSDFS